MRDRLRLPANLDPFLLLLVGTVLLASLLPARGEAAAVVGKVSNAAIVLLFFLHGAKLSRQAILAGLGHWRLHLLVAASTFVLFPILGLLVRAAGGGWLDPDLGKGLLFLCLLPSTVQSSIAFTSIARGNVPAAICSASISNLAGTVITPVLAGLLISGQSAGGGVSLSSIESIALMLVAPFLLGHLSRFLTARWVAKHKAVVNIVDRGSILLVVYVAFSAAVVGGIWSKLSPADLSVILILDAVILAVALFATTLAARTLKFSKEDEIAIVFCGSKKSLASGVPMAGVLFPAAAVGPMILPLMLFHQMQLMVCAVLARRYAARVAEPVKVGAAAE